MFSQRNSVLLLLSSLAILALIVIQLNWLQHSRRLIEEQFDQKVTMALCSAIESLNEEQAYQPLPVYGPNYQPQTLLFPTCGKTCVLPNLNQSRLEQAIGLSLNRYAIDLEFQYEIVPTEFNVMRPETYQTAMTGLAEEDHFLHLQFSGKEAYVIQKMGLMAVASILILILVSALFFFNLYQLIQQRRLNAWNVAYFNNMAHEFRTPLTNIQLALGVWKKKEPQSAQSRFWGVIRSESHHLLHQVERMLDLASLEQGDSFLQLQPLELKAFLEEVLVENELLIEENRGQIELKADSPAPIPLSLDPLHFRNVFRNLIDNAIKYSPGAPQIKIAYTATDGKAHILFQDHGPGLQACEEGDIFQPFQRGEQVQEIKGFGLGLYYVREVIERHGGQIEVESPAEGGCAFHIFLPLKQEAHV